MHMTTDKNIVYLINNNKPSNGSMQNGTIREAEMLAVIRNQLYLCGAFETQVQDIKY